MNKQLKLHVEEIYGIPIKYGNQCKDLSLFIFEQTGDYLSFQTLRRFFGFIENNKNPSDKTLNILSKLCGYLHYVDFCKHSKEQGNKNIIELIYSIPLRKEEDLNFHYACKNIAKSFYFDLNYLQKNIPFLTSSKIALEYFFERFPFLDHINNPIYKRAIKLYSQNKRTLEATIFSESLIYLGDFLRTGVPSKLPIHISTRYLENLHPFLQARIIGTLLIYTVKNRKELISLAFEFEKKQNKKLTLKYKFPFFNYMIADYLILCNLNKEALKMIELGYPDLLSPCGWLETGYYETYELMYCIALERNGEILKATKRFEKINKQHFHFIFQKYFIIQYIKLKIKLKRKISKTEQMALTKIYTETKFFHL
jgi:hypothetical protein